MVTNDGALSVESLLGIVILILTACTDPKGPGAGAGSDSACTSGCDAADADGGDDDTDGSDDASDGGDGDGGGGDGSDVPYLDITSIYPLADATNVPVDVVLEATFVSEVRLTNDNVNFRLYLPPDYDNPVPATTEVYDEGPAEGGLQATRATLTPDDPLRYAAFYDADVAVGYSSNGLGASWNFTTVAE